MSVWCGWRRRVRRPNITSKPTIGERSGLTAPPTWMPPLKFELHPCLFLHGQYRNANTRFKNVVRFFTFMICCSLFHYDNLCIYSILGRSYRAFLVCYLAGDAPCQCHHTHPVNFLLNTSGEFARRTIKQNSSTPCARFLAVALWSHATFRQDQDLRKVSCTPNTCHTFREGLWGFTRRGGLTPLPFKPTPSPFNHLPPFIFKKKGKNPLV